MKNRGGGVDWTLLRPSGPLLEMEEDDEGEGDLMGTSSRPSGQLVAFLKCWESISLTQVTYQGPNTLNVLNTFQSNSMQEDESQYCVSSAP